MSATKRIIETLRRNAPRPKAITPAEFLARNEARRRARGMDPVERRAAIMRGLRRYAARFENAGDPDTAFKINTYLAKAEQALDAEAKARAEAEAPRPDYLADAAAQAAKQLLKTIGFAFTDAVEASAWAIRNLPLTEARAAAAQAADRAMHASKRAAAAGRAWGELVERAAALATSEWDTGKALNRVAESGRDE